MTNRTLAIIGCSLLALLLIRQEARMDQIEDRLDDIIQVRERVNYTQRDLDCLTRNIYYEAGVEDHRGKLAVGQVTINRLKTGHWGDSICRVVYAPKQFSWTMLKKLPTPNETIWAESKEIARKVLAGHRIRSLTQSLYYHATYIRDPKWADSEHEVDRIGNHVFYNRAKGSNLAI